MFLISVKYVSEYNFRNEDKYLLSFKQYKLLRSILSKVMKRDEHSDDEGYFIKSIYYDDLINSSWYDNDSGISPRSKFRIRIYNNNKDQIKLEKKIKVEKYIKKISTPLTSDELDKILNNNLKFLLNTDNQLKKEFYAVIKTKVLKPKIIIEYQREAFVLPYNEIRLTLDTNINSQKYSKDIFNNAKGKLIDDEYRYILEVKYNNFLPTYIKNILSQYTLFELSVSKYYLCRETKNFKYIGGGNNEFRQVK